MGSGAVIYVPSFIKIGSGVQKLIEGGCTDKHTQIAT
jgi:high-affinity Fe2+/Pb2+ permease